MKRPPPPAKKTESSAPPPVSLEETRRPLAQPAPRFAYGWIAATLLLLAVGGLAFWYFSSQSTPPPAEAAIPETNLVAMSPPVTAPVVKPVPAVAERKLPAIAVSNAPPPNAFDKVRLQGILYRSASPLAIINGRTVGVGDRFNGFQVASIDQNSVTLQLNGEQKIFKLNRN